MRILLAVIGSRMALTETAKLAAFGSEMAAG
jgi:hypothetical protein